VDLIAAMPKVELHVHLEGSVQPGTLLRIARRHGLDLGRLDESAVVEMFRFRDFRHFTELFEQCTEALREPEDLELIAYELGVAADRQGVRYQEVTFSPGTHWQRRGLPFDEQIDAVARGARRAGADTGITMRFIVDHVRGESPEAAVRTAEWAVAGRSRGVVALGLGGFEPGRPASLFAEAIRGAAGAGLAFVPHAGEAVGPEAIWDCLAFDPPRIGHGIRAVDDPLLLAELRDRGVVLEVCPTSNLRTGTVANLAAHPLRRLWEAGVRVTLNSDDPSMFHTDVLTEHRLALEVLGFSPRELAELTLVAVDAALLGDDERERLRSRVTAELDGLGFAHRPVG
jgi:adenosine deaminase